jgi:hypothetical protein
MTVKQLPGPVPQYGGDVIIMESEGIQYGRSTYSITAGASDLLVPPGTPFASGTPATAAQVNAAPPTSPAAPVITGITTRKVYIPAGFTHEVSVLERGNIIYDGDNLPVTDLVGAAFTAGKLAAHLNYLGWRQGHEPGTVSQAPL